MYSYRIGPSRTPDIVRDSDGAVIPVDQNNVDWRAFLAWQAAGNVPAPPPLPAPTDADVRAEAHRRICAVLGAVDAAHAALIIADNERELRVLVDAGQASSARAAEIRALDAPIEAVWTAYNAMPDPPPADFAAAGRWA